MTKEQISLFENAAREIRQLRSSNQAMSARLEMFDNIMLLFNTKPDFKSLGFGEDIAYQIDKTIEEGKKIINNLSNTRA